MNDNVKLRIKYWTVLFNWGFVIVYVIGLRYLYLLCQFGGVRRRLPVIAACGLVGIIWLISWTVMYLRGKKKGTQKVPVRHKVSILFLCMQIVVILVSTILYSVKIVNSAKAYNGKLSWKIEEKKNSRQIELVHDNIYKDGINGIFTDLKKKLNLPSELYIANMFSLEFDKEGTITDIYSFFYGKDTDGEEQTYLLDYNSNKSDKMTVWLNRDAKCSYNHSMKMEPMFQILRSVNLQKQINQWTNQYQVSQFEILYYGYRSFQTANGIVIVNDENSGNEDKIPDGVAGYEVSLHVPGKDHITPVRYMNKWEKAVVEGNQKKQKKSIQKVGNCVTDSSDGSLYFYIDQNQGWRLKITDAAAGSRFYELEITHDAGSTWDVIHKDPFHGDAGVAEGMVFFDHNLGYIGMGTATGEYSELYVTKDGGKNFAKVELPVQDVSEEGINISDYDYMYMPYKDGSAIQLMLGQGNDEQDKRLLFESEDHGETWNYSGFITK